MSELPQLTRATRVKMAAVMTRPMAAAARTRATETAAATAVLTRKRSKRRSPSSTPMAADPSRRPSAVPSSGPWGTTQPTKRSRIYSWWENREAEKVWPSWVQIPFIQFVDVWYSGVHINVVRGCVSAVSVHATFDHVYLESRVSHKGVFFRR